MSLKFDYLLAILNKLDNGESVTNRSIIDDQEVSERSAYRYIESLMMAGFPVWYDRKRKSYAFVDGYRLKKLEMAADEALAFAMFKKVMKPFGSGLNEKLDSLQQRLTGRRIAELEHIVIPGESISPEVESCFQQIHRSIIDHRRLKLVYRSTSSEYDSSRIIEPTFLFFQDGMWYVRAYCMLAKEFRTFRLDRIMELTMLEEFFAAPDISPDGELADVFGANIDGELTTVVLRFEQDWLPWITNRQWHPSQQEKQLADGRLEMTFNVRGIDGIKHWIYRWLPGVEVVAPAVLREVVFEELSQAVIKHQKGMKG